MNLKPEQLQFLQQETVFKETVFADEADTITWAFQPSSMLASLLFMQETIRELYQIYSIHEISRTLLGVPHNPCTKPGPPEKMLRVRYTPRCVRLHTIIHSHQMRAKCARMHSHR